MLNFSSPDQKFVDPESQSTCTCIIRMNIT